MKREFAPHFARDCCYLYVLSCRSAVVNCIPLSDQTRKDPKRHANPIPLHPEDMKWTRSYDGQKATDKVLINKLLNEIHGLRCPEDV